MLIFSANILLVNTSNCDSNPLKSASTLTPSSFFSIAPLVGNNQIKTNTNNTTNNSNNVENKQENIEYITLTVDDLEQALEDNAAAAKDTYNNKYVEFTGKLSVIDSDLKYISVESSTKEFDLIGIHCTIKTNEQKEIVKSLTKDEEITIKGKVTDVGEVLGYYVDIVEIVNK